MHSRQTMPHDKPAPVLIAFQYCCHKPQCKYYRPLYLLLVARRPPLCIKPTVRMFQVFQFDFLRVQADSTTIMAVSAVCQCTTQQQGRDQPHTKPLLSCRMPVQQKQQDGVIHSRHSVPPPHGLGSPIYTPERRNTPQQHALDAEHSFLH